MKVNNLDTNVVKKNVYRDLKMNMVKATDLGE